MLPLAQAAAKLVIFYQMGRQLTQSFNFTSPIHERQIRKQQKPNAIL